MIRKNSVTVEIKPFMGDSLFRLSNKSNVFINYNNIPILYNLETAINTRF